MTIRYAQMQPIVKDPLGNFEADPVLDFVGSILGGIPNELHG